jgi:hypothetical protein
MSDVWVSEPRKVPHKCRRSGRNTAAEGPYFEDAVPYAESGGDDRTLTQYISVGWLKTIAAAPGSPVVVLGRDEWEEQVAHVAALVEQNQELEIRVSELEERELELLARLGDSGPIDVEALTNNIVVQLADRLPRRPGPKPREAA